MAAPPYFYSGEYANAILRGTLTPPTLDALTPASWIYDRRASRPAIASAAGNATYTLDGNIRLGTTDPTRIKARAGERLHVDFQSAATARFRSMETGLYLQSNGSWTSTVTTLSADIDFNAEGWSVVGKDWFEIEIDVQAGALTNIFVWPHTDVIAVFGHNLTAEPDRWYWESDDNSGFSSPTVHANNLPPLVGAPFCKTLAVANAERYHRLRVVPNALRKVECSEIVWSQRISSTGASSAGRCGSFPIVESEAMVQNRFESPYGIQKVHVEAITFVRDLQTQAKYSSAELAEYIAMLRRAQYGRWPVLYVRDPDVVAPTPCDLIRPAQTLRWTQPALDTFEAPFAYASSIPPVIIP